MLPSNKIIAAMSGGVDSSVAAMLLRKKDADIIGVTFKMWPKEECGLGSTRACCSLEAVVRARVVAESLNIPYYVFDFSKEFKRHVIDYFCGEYLKGLTPNPCVVCNEKIKFGRLIDKANELGATHVATGHYVRSVYNKKRRRHLLLEGKDKRKDQSYFLFSLSQEQLSKSIFPLGNLTKNRVRVLARAMKIITYDTVSSQDVCFTNDMNYAEYIRKKTGVVVREGDIVGLDGKKLGRHKGIASYTIGQRRGLGVAYSEPLYVVGIDVNTNTIIVGTRRNILKKTLIADNLNWIAIPKPTKPIKVMARIRYNHKKALATVSRQKNNMVRVDFAKSQPAPTPGQAVVFYDKDIVLGGGWIKEAL